MEAAAETDLSTASAAVCVPLFLRLLLEERFFGWVAGIHFLRPFIFL